MRQKLILCDLDGTLLKSDKSISRRSSETFRATRGNLASHACALTGNIHRDKIRANQIKFLINSY